MNFNDFINSLQKNEPPLDIENTLEAMWYAKNHNWDKAHQIAQNISTSIGSWIHAYLHRVEGDQYNAEYWYRKANMRPINDSLNKEANQIIKQILDLNNL